MGETARVTLDKLGKVTVYTGSSPHGQGEETAFAQLASEELGIPLERITVVWGDTVLIPRGIGTFGSRSAATGGSAVVAASRKLKAQILAKAAESLGLDAESLDIRHGAIVKRSAPVSPLLELTDILAKQHIDEISGDSVFNLGAMAYSSGVHLCALTLDVELAKVKVVKYLVVEDCGRMINKTIVEGQLHGGVVHGIGGALLERLVYDEDGNLLNSLFTDYTIPTASDGLDIEVIHRETPSAVTLDGAKGVGESGTIGAYAAVMNALNDALYQIGVTGELNMAPAIADSIFAIIHKVP
jgi:carbon-monoxide dehydrogenase large subunit